LSNFSINFERGTERINDELCGIMSVGKATIANLDRVQRFKNGWELNKRKSEFFFHRRGSLL